MVGAVGFEPTTSWSRTKRATKLRYAPTTNPYYPPIKTGRKLFRRYSILSSHPPHRKGQFRGHISPISADSRTEFAFTADGFPGFSN